MLVALLVRLSPGDRMRRWTHIVVHHSLTKDSDTVSWRAIDHYHREVKGWSDIGYHFGVELAAGEYVALLGRPLDIAGSHCYQDGMNRKALGVMLCGNYDLGAPPGEMLSVTVRRIVVPMMRFFGIPLGNVRRHEEFATYKTCPGARFPWRDFIGRISAQLEPDHPAGRTV